MSEVLPALHYINGAVKSILKSLVISARQRRSKSYPILCKAYSSLKACPIQFTSIRQLLSLAGFGEALVDKIQMQLSEWCIANGKSYRDTQAEASKAAQQRASLTEEDETDSDLDNRIAKKKPIARKSQEKEKPAATAPRKAKKSSVDKTPKTFVPQHRTGTHGILVALFTLTPDWPVEEMESDNEAQAEADAHCYSKATVIEFAQPYSDAKYIPQSNPAINGFGTSYHSAWSAMKTLINRGYVYRKGNPAQFCLSHEGWKVAKICSEREEGLSAGCNQSKIGSASTANEETSKKKKKSSSKGATVETSTTSTTDAPFLYTYLTDSHPAEQTTSRDRASIRLSDEDYRMMYRIAFASESKEHPYVINCVRDISKQGDFMCGWVKEAACNKVAPGMNLAQSSSNDKNRKKTRKSNTMEIVSPSLEPKENQQSTKVNGKEALREQMGSQGNVIELLTSSDVEIDSAKCRIQVKTWTKEKRQSNGSDSDSSALSDLAPVVKQRKISKASRVAGR